jgi:hypothetical protein
MSHPSPARPEEGKEKGTSTRIDEEEYEEICYECGEEEQWCSCDDEVDDDEY